MPGNQLRLPGVRRLPRREFLDVIRRYRNTLDLISKDIDDILRLCPECRPFHNCNYSLRLVELRQDLDRLDAHIHDQLVANGIRPVS